MAEKEGLRITDGALLVLAREAEGSMRDAQSLLEQIISYAAPTAAEEKVQIDEGLLQDILGIAERRVLYDLSEAVIQGDAKRCLDLVADVVVRGQDIGRLSRELVEHFRNLLVVRLMRDQGREDEKRGLGAPVFSPLLDLPDQEIGDLEQQVSELSVDTLMDYFRFMVEGDEEVARSPYPRFSLETALVRLASLPKTMPIAEVLNRLEALEARLSETPRRELHFDQEQGPGMAGPRSPSEPSEKGSKAEVWKKFIAFVMKEKKGLGSHLEQVRPLELPPGKLTIGAEEKYHLSYLQDAENLSLLQDFARRFFSGEVTVAVTRTTSKREGKNGGTGTSGIKDTENDVVQEALRIFGGSIKGIKRET